MIENIFDNEIIPLNKLSHSRLEVYKSDLAE